MWRCFTRSCILPAERAGVTSSGIDQLCIATAGLPFIRASFWDSKVGETQDKGIPVVRNGRAIAGLDETPVAWAEQGEHAGHGNGRGKGRGKAHQQVHEPLVPPELAQPVFQQTVKVQILKPVFFLLEQRSCLGQLVLFLPHFQVKISLLHFRILDSALAY